MAQLDPERHSATTRVDLSEARTVGYSHSIQTGRRRHPVISKHCARILQLESGTCVSISGTRNQSLVYETSRRNLLLYEEVWSRLTVKERYPCNQSNRRLFQFTSKTGIGNEMLFDQRFEKQQALVSQNCRSLSTFQISQAKSFSHVECS